MTAKIALSLILLAALLLELSEWLAMKTGSHVFRGLDTVASFAIIGLLAYAFFRERKDGGKPKKIPIGIATAIISVFVVWGGFCLYRVWTH
jgi:peptidoglycan/LPS O-acetylase OafA/YrhL